jgi:DNA-binding PadR family transcriptional regulator
MSKLLTPENPLIVLPSLACQYGINEAILLQQIHYWLQKTDFTHDGKPWIYNTAEQWHEQIPFVSVGTICRAIDNLRSKQLIFVEKLSRNKSNRTNYYTINYQALEPIIQQALTAQVQKMDQEKGIDPKVKTKYKTKQRLKLPSELVGRVFMGAIHKNQCPIMLGSTLHSLLGIATPSHMDWLIDILDSCEIIEEDAYQIVLAATPFADIHLPLISVQTILRNIDSPQSRAIQIALNKMLNLAFQQIDIDMGEL